MVYRSMRSELKHFFFTQQQDVKKDEHINDKLRHSLEN